jgi:hypothetical protein
LNSLNYFEKEARLDSSLKHVLRNWAGKPLPPRRTRQVLMEKAANIERHRRRIMFLENNGPLRQRHGNGLHFSLFYAPQISFAALWIHY